VFNKAGEGWAFAETLKPSDSKKNDLFGFSVAVEDATIAVGTPASWPLGGIKWNGAAYIFKDDGSRFIQEQKITPRSILDWDRMGKAVAIDRGLIAIGVDYENEERGAVHIYTAGSTTAATDSEPGEETYSLEVFPNPATNWTTVRACSKPSDNKRLTLVSVLGQGREIISRLTSSECELTQIDISDLASGTYIILLESEGRRFGQLLVVR